MDGLCQDDPYKQITLHYNPIVKEMLIYISLYKRRRNSEIISISECTKLVKYNRINYRSFKMCGNVFDDLYNHIKLTTDLEHKQKLKLEMMLTHYVRLFVMQHIKLCVVRYKNYYTELLKDDSDFYEMQQYMSDVKKHKNNIKELIINTYKFSHTMRGVDSEHIEEENTMTSIKCMLFRIDDFVEKCIDAECQRLSDFCRRLQEELQDHLDHYNIVMKKCEVCCSANATHNISQSNLCVDCAYKHVIPAEYLHILVGTNSTSSGKKALQSDRSSVESDDDNKNGNLFDNEAQQSDRSRAHSDDEAQQSDRSRAPSDDEAQQSDRSRAPSDDEAQRSDRSGAPSDDEAEQSDRSAVAPKSFLDDEAEHSDQTTIVLDNRAQQSDRTPFNSDNEAQQSDRAKQRRSAQSAEDQDHSDTEHAETINKLIKNKMTSNSRSGRSKRKPTTPRRMVINSSSSSSSSSEDDESNQKKKTLIRKSCSTPEFSDSDSNDVFDNVTPPPDATKPASPSPSVKAASSPRTGVTTKPSSPRTGVTTKPSSPRTGVKSVTKPSSPRTGVKSVAKPSSPRRAVRPVTKPSSPRPVVKSVAKPALPPPVVTSPPLATSPAASPTPLANSPTKLVARSIVDWLAPKQAVKLATEIQAEIQKELIAEIAAEVMAEYKNKQLDAQTMANHDAAEPVADHDAAEPVADSTEPVQSMMPPPLLPPPPPPAAESTTPVQLPDSTSTTTTAVPLDENDVVPMKQQINTAPAEDSLIDMIASLDTDTSVQAMQNETQVAVDNIPQMSSQIYVVPIENLLENQLVDGGAGGFASDVQSQVDFDIPLQLPNLSSCPCTPASQYELYEELVVKEELDNEQEQEQMENNDEYEYVEDLLVKTEQEETEETAEQPEQLDQPADNQQQQQPPNDGYYLKEDIIAEVIDDDIEIVHFPKEHKASMRIFKLNKRKRTDSPNSIARRKRLCPVTSTPDNCITSTTTVTSTNTSSVSPTVTAASDVVVTSPSLPLI
uniref:Mucin-like protein n=1 Tax=Lymantria dispar multicapsid nuclear polyhedrosis virus TaxID=10449 RepID=A0A1B1MQK8_NPVLD|nr:mucin-like protein [Lymantria dispar multiple nucleopolyhedrovirus]